MNLADYIITKAGTFTAGAVEALVAERDALREALLEIAERDPYPGVVTRLTAQTIARAALASLRAATGNNTGDDT